MPRKPSPQGIPEKILRHVTSGGYRPQKPRRLAHAMGVADREYPAFRAAVKELMRAGRIVQGGGNCVMLPDAKDRIVGSFRGHARGFGFVVPDAQTEHGDLFIPPKATLQAMTGDKVVARITRRGRGESQSRVEGEVIEILERSDRRFVGALVKDGRRWLVRPEGHVLLQPIVIPDARSSRAREGDQVVVELTEYPAAEEPGRGVIVEVLGRHGDPGIDTLSIIRQHGFPEGFSEKVVNEARETVAGYKLEEELAVREDLREEVIVTIDPDDAKDYDDAISVRSAGKGGYELGVHIADVARMVPAGGALDTEAAQRGNSVYLPRHVIPMLPEVLSNGLCSLQEGEPRLAKSAFITYDAQGNRQRTRFANTVIRSSRRLTYREADAILGGKTDGYAPEVVTLLKRMDRLARRIQKRRLARGMIVLDLPEVELVLDDEGNVTDVEPADTSFPHTIIEMFMVEANEVVAELFTRQGVPHLRRTHADPPADAQKKLATFLRVLKRSLRPPYTREDLLKLLAEVRGRPEAFAVNLAVLRSMARAEYTTRPIGHYALASEHYSHFTSPIRRYPDLVAHRLLDLYLHKRLTGSRGRQKAPGRDALAAVGKHCTYSEQRAETAERELRLIKILRLLESRLGDVEEGVVTGVAGVGLYVQLRRYLVDGLIRFRDLPDDWWDIDTAGGCVRGQHSGRRIAIGDLARVQIAAVNVPARELVLSLIEDSGKRFDKSKKHR
ncbi:MAG: ribonuclease R [Phycisphaerae bacterium]|nr:ribonuclease R [Phycisphaerae bacterium]